MACPHPFLILLVLAGCVTTGAVHVQADRNNRLCVDAIERRDLDWAEIYCDHALEFAPQWGDVWSNKGLIEWMRGHAETAKADLIKAVHCNPEQAQAYSNLGVIYLADKDYGAARQAFERALKVNPDYSEARNDLGLTYFYLGDFSAARRQFRTLVAVNPLLAMPHHELGVIAMREKHLEEAIAELSRATQLDPRLTIAWLDLGAALDNAGRFDEAKDAFGACLDSDPSEDRCRANYAAEVEKLAVLRAPRDRLPGR
jgi:Flp pilus assembly protein TadD